MRVLLDTNIIIHREASRVINRDIGILFGWLDRLKADKCVHPYTLKELNSHQDPIVRQTMATKVQNYQVLKTLAPESAPIIAIKASDRGQNDEVDTALVNEAYANRVDLLLTEDRKMHGKAARLGISQKVLNIDEFLTKVVSENPDLAEYKVLSARKVHFGNINIADHFFDSFKEDYIGFEAWFNKKADEIAYVCKDENDNILAFLYVKSEDEHENYSAISPIFCAARRLKIGTFKVVLNGHRLGERFIKIIFDNAIRYNVDEIYVTIFNKREEQGRLIELLGEWGFVYYGTKISSSGKEQVYVRNLQPKANLAKPSTTFPFISTSAHKFIVPIYPAYHTELFPDSRLNRESPEDFVESFPHRNALRKVYISRSINRNLSPGDVIVFYRTKPEGPAPAHYTSVVTTLGVVESIVDAIPDLNTFLALCRKRSVFSDDELKEHWNYNARSRPFVVNFIYFYSFRPPFPNLATLRKHGILHSAPRGFEPLEDSLFEKLLEVACVNKRFVVN